MRHSKIAKQLRKKAPSWTVAEHAAKRRFKRKNGPAALRRAERRRPFREAYAAEQALKREPVAELVQGQPEAAASEE